MVKINVMILFAFCFAANNTPLLSAEFNPTALNADLGKKYKFATTAVLATMFVGNIGRHYYNTLQRKKKIDVSLEWKRMIQEHGLEPYRHGVCMYARNKGWYENQDQLGIMKGKRSSLLLVDSATHDCNYDFTSKTDLHQEYGRILSGQYKIHLMPTDSTINTVLDRLLGLITSSQELQDVIHTFKIYSLYQENMQQVQEGNASVFPRIIIYPADGKKNAQKALDIIYDAFREEEGLNLRPRFNAKVTSLIYVAQGDADFKKMESYPPQDRLVRVGEQVKYPKGTPCIWQRYYEKPHKVYYNQEMPLEPGSSDHYLRFPGTDSPIIDVE